jgi:hypothetical protein
LGVHAQAPFKGEIEIAAKLRVYNLEDYHPEAEGATLTSAEHPSNAITLGPVVFAAGLGLHADVIGSLAGGGDGDVSPALTHPVRE